MGAYEAIGSDFIGIAVISDRSVDPVGEAVECLLE